MKTVPLIRKHTLALAIGSALLAPLAVQAAGPKVADGVNLTLTPDTYTSAPGTSSLRAINGGSITNSGPIIVTNTNLTGTGAGNHGAYILGAGSSMTLTNAAISTVGQGGKGMLVGNGGHGQLVGGGITTNGSSAAAMYVGDSNGAASAELRDIDLHTLGAGAEGILAKAAGTQVSLINGNVLTEGNGSRGVSAGSGASLNVQGGKIATRGTTSHGALAISEGSEVALTGVDIDTGGDTAFGLRAQLGGHIESTDTTVVTRGAGAIGIYATALEDQISSINFTGGSVSTGGVAAHGARADVGARLDLTDTTIDTIGDGAHGIYAESGSTVNATRVDVTTSGGVAHGVFADGASSKVNLIDGSVTTTGAGSYGLNAENGAVISANGTVVNTSGASAGADGLVTRTGATISGKNLTVNAQNNAVSVYTDSSVDLTDSRVISDSTAAIVLGGELVATNTDFSAKLAGVRSLGGQVSLTGGSVTIADGGIGAMDSWQGGQVSLKGVTVTSGGYGATVSTGSTLSMTESALTSAGIGVNVGTESAFTAERSSITTTGTGAIGVKVANARADLKDTHVRAEGASAWGAQVNGTLNVDGGSLVSAQHGAINATGDASIALSNSAQAIGGNGTLLSIANEGSAVSLSMDNKVYAEGDIVGVDTDGDGTLLAGTNVSLANTSHWKGATDGSVDQLSLASGSQWTMTGDSMVGQLSLNDSVIAFHAPTAGDFKTLTVTGDFASNGGTLLMNTVLGDDRSATDKLHVLGNTSGQANVAVNNVGGVGAQTVEGIQIIQVDGASNGQFNLAGRAVGGLYEYFLFKGGKTDPNDGDWYLRSELPVVPPDPCEADPNAPGCTPVVPPDPCEADPNAPGCKPVEPPVPVLRPEVGAYLANQTAAVGMFQHAMHDRLGEPNLAERLKTDDTLASAWARVESNQADYGAVEGQIDVNSNSALLHIGTDIAQWGQNSRGLVGIMAAAGRANNTATSKLTGYAAQGKVEGTALGVYGSWFSDPAEATGAYVDAWLQAGRYKNSVQGEGLAQENYEAKSLTASMEAGYAWKAYADDAKAFYLEPQAQVIYTDYRSDDHREANGTLVSVEQAGGLTTRMGLRAYGHAIASEGNQVQPFVTANWYRQSDANAMSFNSETLVGGVPRDRYELKGGLQMQLSNHWTGWGQLGVQVGKDDYRNIGAQLGVKYSW